MKSLYRPVGLKEMELILDLESRGFPPRLQEQPIFYPVLNIEYAVQIAREWNANDINSGYVGFVTRFGVEEEYISQFEEKLVGSATHRELWVPAERLKEFNDRILTKIDIVDAFYGAEYKGPIPEKTNLKDKDVNEQFRVLSSLVDYNGMDFRCEVACQWRLVLLNYKYWVDVDFSSFGLQEEKKQRVLKFIAEVWKENHPDLNLAGTE